MQDRVALSLGIICFPLVASSFARAASSACIPADQLYSYCTRWKDKACLADVSPEEALAGLQLHCACGIVAATLQP